MELLIAIVCLVPSFLVFSLIWRHGKKLMNSNPGLTVQMVIDARKKGLKYSTKGGLISR